MQPDPLLAAEDHGQEGDRQQPRDRDVPWIAGWIMPGDHDNASDACACHEHQAGKQAASQPPGAKHRQDRFPVLSKLANLPELFYRQSACSLGFSPLTLMISCCLQEVIARLVQDIPTLIRTCVEGPGQSFEVAIEVPCSTAHVGLPSNELTAPAKLRQELRSSSSARRPRSVSR